MSLDAPSGVRLAREVVMNNGLAVLLVAAAAVWSVSTLAQSPPAAGRADAGVPVDAAQSTPADSTTLSVRGRIDKYDPSTRMLSLSTSNGTVQIPLPQATRIRRGWRRVDPAELGKLVGNRATVRYTRSGGNTIVASVHVFGK
jgi:hypothetical protein